MVVARCSWAAQRAPNPPWLAQEMALPVALAGGGRATLHLVVRATEVKGVGVEDDAMSVMTGASGLSSTSPSEEEGRPGRGIPRARGRAVHSCGSQAATIGPCWQSAWEQFAA